MKKIYLIVLFLFTVVFISACTSSNVGHQIDSDNVVEQQANVGIEKGDIHPDFIIKTIDGKQLRLSQFREENKPILLYFWATWCPFCKRDFSIVKNIYPKYADKVTFLAIDLDTSENAQIIQQYKNSLGLEGIDFAPGNGKVLSDYQITHTTTKYAVGKNGLMLYKGSGVFDEQQWETLLTGLANS